MRLRIVILIVIAVITSFSQSLANKCKDYVLLDGTEDIISYGIDSTQHWWALTAPFSDNYRLIVDGKKTNTYKTIKGLQFSPDGNRWACYAKDNQQWYLLSNDTIIPLTATDAGEIQYSPNSQELVYSYLESNNEIIHIRDRKITVLYRKSKIFLSNGGERFAFTGARGDKYVVNMNGTESQLYDDIMPIGFWYDGRFMYAARTANTWEIYRGTDVISEPLTAVIDYKINLRGTVAGALVRLQNGKVVSMLVSDEYYEPLIGKQYDVGSFMALHPESSMLAFRAEMNGQPFIVLNNTEYYGGTAETGFPMFTHNGEELYFFGNDMESFVNINGMKKPIQANLSTSLAYAMKPGSMTIAYSTNSSMIMRDLESGLLYAGVMVDEICQPRFNWRTDCYEALGRVNRRLYLLTCKP